ncbi:MAG TPA: HAD-IA family hydrolase [Gammaproteobacteria bacterium]
MSREFKLLVFDWDGTLMDSEARIVACLRAASADLGLEVLPDATIRNIIGLGLREAIDALYPGSNDEIHHGMTERYRHHFLTADPTPTQLFEGAAETLQALAGEGYLLAVATGKGRNGLNRVLEETGLLSLFHTTRCADETFSKPHPLMLTEIMEELGTEPDETLMIGDTEYDMLMARNARTEALAVSYGVHELERLLKYEPAGHINSITELLPWLASGPA